MPSPKTHKYVSASPSGSLEPPPSNVSGELTNAAYGPPAVAEGPRFTFATVIRVVAEPESALVAVKITAYGSARASLKVGVQVKVPPVWVPLTVNAELFPTGSPETSAVSDPIASPSASDAVTVTLRDAFSTPAKADTTLTLGGRSLAGAQPRFRRRITEFE